MRGLDVIVVLSTLSRLASAADSARPRGVGPEFAKFYKDHSTFTCISNPSIQISFSQVNDDFCDCPDGSDEPGTSACSHLSNLSPQYPTQPGLDDVATEPVLPGYYCKNKGHNPAYIPFTFVNDGVCDYDVCCDGSDEWAEVGGLKCADKCKEIGKEWKKQTAARQKSMSTALKKRKDLVAEGARLRLEVTNHIEDLKTKIEAQQSKVTNLEQQVAELERTEKSRVVRASTTGGKLGVLATLVKDKLKELRTSLAQIKDQRDTIHDDLRELESILSTFKDEYNPNFNDEGVKRAVRAWEDYAARSKPEHEYATDPDVETFVNGDDGIVWEEFETQQEDDVAILYRLEAYLPASLREWIDAQLQSLRDIMVANGMLAPSTSSSSSPPSKALSAARNELSSARGTLDTHRTDEAAKHADLATDYGADDVFRSLKDKCISLDSGEYTYELCWLAGAAQKSKKGGGSTSLGSFARFETITTSDAPRPDGKGVGSGDRTAMKYDNGQNCWNGPNRSVTVVLACYETEEIWKVTEEEKCVYRMEVGTPAVCVPPAAAGGEGAAGNGAGKDEL